MTVVTRDLDLYIADTEELERLRAERDALRVALLDIGTLCNSIAVSRDAVKEMVAAALANAPTAGEKP